MLGALKARSSPSSLPVERAEPVTPSFEVVETEIGGLESVDLVGQIGGDVGIETQPNPVEIGDAGKAHAHGIGVGFGLDWTCFWLKSPLSDWS